MRRSMLRFSRISAYLVLTRIAVHRVNLERGHVLLERAEQLANTRGWGG
jgi:hypothetical protein